MNNQIDLGGKWTELWNTITGMAGATQLQALLSIFGMILVVVAVISWIWQRRRGGGGGGSQQVMGALIVGVLLSLPGVVLPAVLNLLDLVVNAIVAIYNKNALH